MSVYEKTGVVFLQGLRVESAGCWVSHWPWTGGVQKDRRLPGFSFLLEGVGVRVFYLVRYIC